MARGRSRNKAEVLERSVVGRSVQSIEAATPPAVRRRRHGRRAVLAGLAVFGLPSVLLAGCGDQPPGGVVAIVRGVGTMKSQAFTLDQGTYRVEEKSTPASCVGSIALDGPDGTTVATVKPAVPESSPAPSTEDQDWTGTDLDVSDRGTYIANGTAAASCQWVLRVVLPDAEAQSS